LIVVLYHEVSIKVQSNFIKFYC